MGPAARPIIFVRTLTPPAADHKDDRTAVIFTVLPHLRRHLADGVIGLILNGNEPIDE